MPINLSFFLCEQHEHLHRVITPLVVEDPSMFTAYPPVAHLTQQARSA